MRSAGAQPEDDLRVETMHGLDGLRDIAADWNDLFERAALPHQLFQSHAFLSAWAKNYAGTGNGLIIVAVRSGDRLVAAAPLLLRRRFGLKTLAFMGAPVAQFGDILADPPGANMAIPLLWNTIAGLGADLFEARRIRQDGAFWSIATDDRTVFEKLESPYADLTRRVDGTEAGAAYTSKEKSNLRRRLRRLGERGNLVMRVYRPGAEALPLAERAVELKRAALKRDGVYARAITRSRFSNFFKEAASDPASGLMVSTIELDDRPIGIDLSFLCKGVGFGHVLATEGEFDREGLGQLLVHHVFAQARNSGATAFDLLVPADPYKLSHADGVTHVESRAYPFTAKGRMAAKAYALAFPFARKATRHIPAWALRTWSGS